MARAVIDRKKGRAARVTSPPPGWNQSFAGSGLINPRPPAVTVALSRELTLERYFAAGALIGILASQMEEPNRDWAATWALEMGEQMARSARRRRRPKNKT